MSSEMSKFAAAISITRPVNFAIAFASITAAGFICAGSTSFTPPIFFAALSGSLIGAAGNIINDILDLKIDMINRPERVLPSGRLSSREAVFLYILINSAALILSYFAGTGALIIAAIAAAVIFFYSYRLKGIPLAGNFTVAFITGLAFVYGGAAVGNWKEGILPGVFAFFINFIRELLKDIEDMKGDSAAGAKTFPAVFGVKKSVSLLKFLTLALIILTSVPFVFHLYGILYFVIVMLTVNVLLVFFIKELKPSLGTKELRKLSNLLKLIMVLGLAAIIAGNL